MYYQQKRTIVTLVVAAALLAAFIVYVVGKLSAGAATPDDAKFFAVTILTFIGISTVATIVLQIVFHIFLSVSVAVREREKDSKAIETAINAEMVEDERDKLIELKSTRISFLISVVGFVAGLILLAFGVSVGLMLCVLYGAFSLGTIGDSAAKLIYYRLR